MNSRGDSFGMRLSRPGRHLFVVGLACVSLSLRGQSLGEPEPPDPADEFSDAQIENPIVGAAGVIDHRGGRLITPDGAVEMEWAPNPARPPTPAKIWSIIAPGGAGFEISGPAGPGKLTCWPPGTERTSSPAGAGDPIDPAPPSPAPANDGGVEILGPDQAWTSTKNTLNPDGSRTIEIIDERTALRKKGLVKGTTGPYVIVPDRATVLRGKSLPFRTVNKKQQQEEWKKAVKQAAEDEELAPITPVKKPGGDAKKTDDEELAPITPVKGAGAPEDEELAPITPTKKGGATPAADEDDLAPIAPRKPAPKP